MRVGIALGSNLGRRLVHLQEARDMLRRMMPRGAKLLQSPIFQTAPVNCPPNSPDFYNTVIEISYRGTPQELLEKTQEIEEKLGRLPQVLRNAPRSIDVDLLYFGDKRVDSEDLILPHPRLTLRRFVLKPLAEIRPDLILPGDTATIAEHLEHLDSSEPELSLVQSAW